MGWPISERLRAEHGDDVLHEGIPDWLWSSLVPWERARLSDYHGLDFPPLAGHGVMRLPLTVAAGSDVAAVRR